MADIKRFNITGIASDVQIGSRGGRLKYDAENSRFDFVQSNDNILEDVRFGTVTAGTWQANTIESQYGGTGLDASTSTGVLQFEDGSATISNLDLSNTSYVTGILSVENGGTGSNTGSINTIGNISAAYFIGNGSQLTGITAVTSYTDANVITLLSTYGNAISSNANITTTANIEGNFFIGNGSALTGFVSKTANVDSVNGVSGVVILDTGDIAEGTNLYFSNARANSAIAAYDGNITTTGNIQGNFFIGNGSLLTGIAGGGSSYTDANVIALLGTYGNAISSNANITTTANIEGNFFIGNGSQLTGFVSKTANVNSVNGATGNVTLTTTDIVEGDNLYFSNARVNAFIQDNITTTDIDEGDNLYFSNARVNAFIQDNITTTDIDEGSNLYYTTSRANTAIDSRIVTAVENANVKLKKFAETVVNLGNVSGDISSNIDLGLGTIFTMTATGNITINSMANVSSGISATLIITQDGTGNRLLTSNWKFADSSKVLSTAANTTDIVSTVFAGNVYYATLSKGYA
jgi:hypothetical protein